MPGEGGRDRFGPSRASRAAQLERTLRYGQAGILFLLALVVIGFGTSALPVAHWAVALELLLVALDVLARGPRIAQVVFTAALTLLTAGPVFAMRSDTTAGIVASATTVCIVRAVPERARLAAVLLLQVCLLSVRTATGSSGLWLSIELAVAGPVVAYMAGMLATYLERGTERADAAAAQADADWLTLRRQQSADRAVRAARRLLHDEVLSALRALATRRTGSPPGADQVRALSRRAVEAMQRLTGPTTPGRVDRAPLGALDQVLARVIAESPVQVDLRVHPTVRRSAVTPEVQDAIGRALVEALRNVARHSGCDEATLEVIAGPGTIELSVEDEGAGLPRDVTPGVGTTESIHGAVEAVGGRATIDSSSTGCVVRLVLPLGPGTRRSGVLQHAREQTEAAGGPIGGLVWPVAGPLIAVQICFGVKYSWPRSDQVSQLALLLVTVAVAVGYVGLLARKAPRDWVGGLFHLALVAIVLVTIQTTPIAGLLTWESWNLGFVGNILFVALFLVPLAWAIPILVVNVAVLLVTWQVAPGLSAGALPVGALNALVFTPLVAALLGAQVRRDGRSVHSDRARRLDSLAELELRRQLSRAVSLHLDHTRRVIVPWLARVVDGELDPADPEVRARARVLEREARDDLHAAGFFDDRLREEVSRYRAGGGTVEIRPGLRPGSHARSTGALLDSLVRALPPRHRITVSPTPQDPERARVAVVPPPPAPLGAVIPRGAQLVEHDQDRLVLTVTEAGA